ncbi:MAG TPA: transcriptional repressor, partial [Blastocatellia bacterium]
MRIGPIMASTPESSYRKLRFSNQRSLVHQIVESAHDHPTAQVVFERARKEKPSISLGTVYRN